MLNVTDTACAHMTRLLDDHGAPEDAALRFVVEGDRLALRLDAPQPEDATFNHDGRTVLVMDQRLAEMLNERTLDVQETEQGVALALV